MKLAIFGGTGRTGQHLVQQALDAGHQVTVMARSPEKLAIQHEKLRMVQGDIRDEACIEEIIAGADAVLSVLGPTSNKPEFAISKGTERIVRVMKKHQLRRIIISAGAGIRDPQDKPKLIDHFFGLLLNMFSKNAVADMKQTVNKLRSSGLAWTVVRVPMLTDEPAKGDLKVGYVGDTSPRLSRADMAAFMLKQLTDSTYIGKAPAISN